MTKPLSFPGPHGDHTTKHKTTDSEGLSYCSVIFFFLVEGRDGKNEEGPRGKQEE